MCWNSSGSDRWRAQPASAGARRRWGVGIESDAAVDITVTDRPDGGVRIAIADDGPGIPDAEWSVVAGDRESTQLQHASGLGVWPATWLADRHGGDLELVSADADGTTVAIDLPPARSVARDRARITGDAPLTRRSPGSGAGAACRCTRRSPARRCGRT